jgi:phosphonoacetaldehyde hydrolase
MENNKTEMVVFDWAGTTVDYGSAAPHTVFDRVFTNHSIHLTPEEIDKPMGMEKRAHIRSLLSCPSGAAQFEQINSRRWDEKDVDSYYEEFEKTLYDVVAEFSSPIDGTVETVNLLRSKGLKIASTTGYTSQIMERVIPKAREAGYEADVVMTPDIVGASRPTPFMIFACMQKLNVYPPCHVVKVGDTVVDMQEGKNAGAWSIGILKGSNLLGLTEEQYENMPVEELSALEAKATRIYYEAGADYVIDSIHDLPAAIDEINSRLCR